MASSGAAVATWCAARSSVSRARAGLHSMVAMERRGPVVGCGMGRATTPSVAMQARDGSVWATLASRDSYSVPICGAATRSSPTLMSAWRSKRQSGLATRSDEFLR
jgi:hypothetical protein